jgi:hypothetical protein
MPKSHIARLTDAEQARRAAALAAAQLDRITNEVIPSAARTVDGAKPEKKMLVFRLQAAELISYVRKGVVDRVSIVDALQDMAQTNGLIEIHGQDEIQRMPPMSLDLSRRCCKNPAGRCYRPYRAHCSANEPVTSSRSRSSGCGPAALRQES